jgi:hypothetical protein
MNDRTRTSPWRVLFADSIGSFVKFYDRGLCGLFATTLAPLFFPRFDHVAALPSSLAVLAVGYVARPLGGNVLGHLGDRIGRRSVLLITVPMFDVAAPAVGYKQSGDGRENGVPGLAEFLEAEAAIGYTATQHNGRYRISSNINWCARQSIRRGGTSMTNIHIRVVIRMCIRAATRGDGWLHHKNQVSGDNYAEASTPRLVFG